MQRKVSFILIAFLCLVYANHAATAFKGKPAPAYKQGSRLDGEFVGVNNNTFTTFSIRMRNTATSIWYYFEGYPGVTNIGPVPGGFYDVTIFPVDGGQNMYSFSGFCDYFQTRTGTGYTVTWDDIKLPGDPFTCANQIYISHY